MERCVLLLNIYCVTPVLGRRIQFFFSLQGIIISICFIFFWGGGGCSDLPFSF